MFSQVSVCPGGDGVPLKKNPPGQRPPLTETPLPPTEIPLLTLKSGYPTGMHSSFVLLFIGTCLKSLILNKTKPLLIFILE